MYSMRVRLTVLLVAVSVVCLAAGASAATEELTKDGILHIMNGSEPAQGVDMRELEEAWRVGGEDGEDFFGLVSQVVVGDDGTIYLLDTRLAEVAVYSPDGERLGTLSREGEGPGETRMPAHLLFMPDGNLGLVQVFPGKVTKIDLEGNPAGVFEIGANDPTQGGFVQFFDCMVQGENLVIAAESIKQNPPTGQIRTSYVAAYNGEGDEVARYAAFERVMDFTAFEFDEDKRNQVEFRKSIVGNDGRVYVAPYRNEYKIEVYLPDGTLDRVIEREYEHMPRTDEEYDAVKAVLDIQLQQLPNPKVSISRVEPDIGALRLGPDGNIWVETSRGGRNQPEGVFFTWDVFSPEGRFLKQVSAQCGGDGTDDMMLWTGDGAIQVTGFITAIQELQSRGAMAADDDGEAVPMEVIYYRVK